MNRMRRSLAAVTVLMMMAAAWFWALPAYVEAKVKEAASVRGLRAEIGGMSISWRKVVLRDVKVSSEEPPKREAELDEVVVHVDKVLEIERVEVRGGRVTLRGSLKEVRGTGGRTGGRTGGKGLERTVEGVSVRWEDAAGRGTLVEVTDASYRSGEVGARSVRASDGRLKISAEGVRWVPGEREVELDDLKVEMGDPINWIQAAREKGSGRPKRGGDPEKVGGRGVSLRAKLFDMKIGSGEVRGEEIRTEAGVEDGTVNLSVKAGKAEVSGRISFEEASVDVRIGSNGDGFKVEGGASARTIKTRYGKVTEGEIRAEAGRAEGRIYLANDLALATAVGSAGFGAASVDLSGRWGKGESLEAEAELPPTGCQDLLESVPPSVVPELVPGTRLSGTLGWRVQVEVDLPDRAKPSVRMKLDNGCRIEEVPEGLNAGKLGKPFELEVYGRDGRRERRKAGPGTEEWVPLILTSRFVPVAFKTLEDPGFLAHRGFHVEAIENSAKMNITAGRFVRGASTISMQLAKNLWLSRDKTVSRKVQEAVLTTYLEQELSKERILELYLNVVEFGPGLYGIGPASERYFGAHPAQLSLTQSLFLASLLPDPSKSHFTADGKVHPAKMRWLHRVMKAMRDRQLISADEYAEGIREVLVYGQPSTEAGKPEEVEASEEGLDPSDWTGID